MELTLQIGNMNYSSWTMRAGVLLRAFGIAFTKKLIISGRFQADSTFKKISSSTDPYWDRTAAERRCAKDPSRPTACGYRYFVYC